MSNESSVKRARKQPLKVAVKGGVLTISIGVETLKWAAEHHEGHVWPLTNKFSIVVGNADQFAKDIKAELELEQEDGTTPVHILIDKAVDALMESGSEGLDEEAMEALEEAERAEERDGE